MSHIGGEVYNSDTENILLKLSICTWDGGSGGVSGVWRRSCAEELREVQSVVARSTHVSDEKYKYNFTLKN